MIKSISFKENYELLLSKKSQKRWGYKTYKPTRWTREKHPWKMFSLFKKGLSINFNEGVNIIVGDNGTGKSTLFFLIKNYAGKKPDKLTFAFSDIKNEDEYIKYQRDNYHGELLVDGEISFKNSIFFSAEADNPVTAIPKMLNPDEKSFMGLSMELFNAQEESHGESMKPIVEYILANAKNCMIFMDEPDTALSLKNQIWLGKLIQKSAKNNNNQIFVSTHALALINMFPKVFDMETRTWKDREIFVSEMMK